MRIDPQVNGYVWKNGIRNVPNRIRVRFERKINDKEDAKDKYFVEVKFLDVKSFHNLKSKRAEVSSKWSRRGSQWIAEYNKQEATNFKQTEFAHIFILFYCKYSSFQKSW